MGLRPKLVDFVIWRALFFTLRVFKCLGVKRWANDVFNLIEYLVAEVWANWLVAIALGIIQITLGRILAFKFVTWILKSVNQFNGSTRFGIKVFSQLWIVFLTRGWGVVSWIGFGLVAWRVFSSRFIETFVFRAVENGNFIELWRCIRLFWWHLSLLCAVGVIMDCLLLLVLELHCLLLCRVNELSHEFLLSFFVACLFVLVLQTGFLWGWKSWWE